MRARIVKRAEIDRVGEVRGGLPLAPLGIYESPSTALIVVEDDKGEVVAMLTVYNPTHFEDSWVAESHRGNPGIIRPLLRQAVAIPALRGANWVFGGAEEGDTMMHKILRSLGGAPLRGVTFSVLPIGEGSCLERF